jgi:hypothetical protein
MKCDGHWPDGKLPGGQIPQPPRADPAPKDGRKRASLGISPGLPRQFSPDSCKVMLAIEDRASLHARAQFSRGVHSPCRNLAQQRSKST